MELHKPDGQKQLPAVAVMGNVPFEDGCSLGVRDNGRIRRVIRCCQAGAIGRRSRFRNKRRDCLCVLSRDVNVQGIRRGGRASSLHSGMGA